MRDPRTPTTLEEDYYDLQHRLTFLLATHENINNSLNEHQEEIEKLQYRYEKNSINIDRIQKEIDSFWAQPLEIY